MRVRYTKTALRQLREILGYIQSQSPQGERHAQQRIAELLTVLETHPRIGVRTDDRRIRRLVATPYPYVILYQVRADDVVIRSFRHGARESN